jgi:aminoglycoside phosphotransferase (APT) family kinase protein
MPEPTMTPEALERFLASAEPGRRAAVTAFRPITGGYSRLSAVADVTWDDGVAQRLVLRGDPPPGDGVFVSDRDAEWRMLRALSRARSVPVARPRWYDATGEHFGDPREDLGYYTQIPMAPNVYHRDPQGFLARYRERTGLTEEQVNPGTVEYFLVIGMAHLLAQILRALDAVSRGETRGIMATYLLNAVTHQYGLYLDICRRVAA